MELFTPDELEEISVTLKGMTEKEARLFLARRAKCKGYGAITALARYCHVSRGRIYRGLIEINAGEVYQSGDRSRKAGGGRWPIEKTHKAAMDKLGDNYKEFNDINKVVDDICDTYSYGDPMKTGKWCNASIHQVSEEVKQKTYQNYSDSVIRKIAKRLGYSFQKNKKYDQVGEDHPNRDDQFQHIEEIKNEYRASGDPIISIDTKAKLQLGNFFHMGTELRRKKDPRRVGDHDFAEKFKEIYPDGSPYIPNELMDKLAIIPPYGIYDPVLNTGYVVFGTNRDTSEFAVESILKWWQARGKNDYPNAKRLLILADGGGSNKSSGYLWKEAVQQLSDILQFEIQICHYPPGTSKYNPIERKLWSQVSRTWAAKPIFTLEHAVNYAKHTTTKTGLTVSAEILPAVYYTGAEKRKMLEAGVDPYGIIDTKELQKDINIEHYEADESKAALRKWNYIIRPHSKEKCWVNYRKPAFS